MKAIKREIEMQENWKRMCKGCGCDIEKDTEKCTTCKKLSGCCNERITDDNYCSYCECELDD